MTKIEPEILCDYETKQVVKLRELLPGYASPANPLDMTATLSYDTEG